LKAGGGPWKKTQTAALGKRFGLKGSVYEKMCSLLTGLDRSAKSVTAPTNVGVSDIRSIEGSAAHSWQSWLSLTS
jgi:hypothetical protein